MSNIITAAWLNDMYASINSVGNGLGNQTLQGILDSTDALPLVERAKTRWMEALKAYSLEYNRVVNITNDTIYLSSNRDGIVEVALTDNIIRTIMVKYTNGTNSDYLEYTLLNQENLIIGPNYIRLLHATSTAQVILSNVTNTVVLSVEDNEQVPVKAGDLFTIDSGLDDIYVEGRIDGTYLTCITKTNGFIYKIILTVDEYGVTSYKIKAQESAPVLTLTLLTKYIDSTVYYAVRISSDAVLPIYDIKSNVPMIKLTEGTVVGDINGNVYTYLASVSNVCYLTSSDGYYILPAPYDIDKFEASRISLMPSSTAVTRTSESVDYLDIWDNQQTDSELLSATTLSVSNNSILLTSKGSSLSVLSNVPIWGFKDKESVKLLRVSSREALELIMFGNSNLTVTDYISIMQYSIAKLDNKDLSSSSTFRPADGILTEDSSVSYNTAQSYLGLGHSLYTKANEDGLAISWPHVVGGSIETDLPIIDNNRGKTVDGATRSMSSTTIASDNGNTNTDANILFSTSKFTLNHTAVNAKSVNLQCFIPSLKLTGTPLSISPDKDKILLTTTHAVLKSEPKYLPMVPVRTEALIGESQDTDIFNTTEIVDTRAELVNIPFTVVPGYRLHWSTPIRLLDGTIQYYGDSTEITNLSKQGGYDEQDIYDNAEVERTQDVLTMTCPSSQTNTMVVYNVNTDGTTDMLINDYNDMSKMLGHDEALGSYAVVSANQYAVITERSDGIKILFPFYEGKNYANLGSNGSAYGLINNDIDTHKLASIHVGSSATTKVEYIHYRDSDSTDDLITDLYTIGVGDNLEKYETNQHTATSIVAGVIPNSISPLRNDQNGEIYLAKIMPSVVSNVIKRSADKRVRIDTRKNGALVYFTTTDSSDDTDNLLFMPMFVQSFYFASMQYRTLVSESHVYSIPGTSSATVCERAVNSIGNILELHAGRLGEFVAKVAVQQYTDDTNCDQELSFQRGNGGIRWIGGMLSYPHSTIGSTIVCVSSPIHIGTVAGAEVSNIMTAKGSYIPISACCAMGRYYIAVRTDARDGDTYNGDEVVGYIPNIPSNSTSEYDPELTLVWTELIPDEDEYFIDMIEGHSSIAFITNKYTLYELSQYSQEVHYVSSHAKTYDLNGRVITKHTDLQDTLRRYVNGSPTALARVLTGKVK